MSYYDFDNHFWSAKQVCCQSKLQNKKRKINPNITPKTVLIGAFALVCAAISTTALIKYKTAVNSDIREDNSESACIVLGRETFRMYCPLSKK
ncbi:hypothetical protein ACE1AT_14055 [Pelatocladus sp. BLCC-F211]|uniref:hypothetical protein n=1 Tax=Pelatocladus sp. BLCC-F211 TaxID=3342752 RepID=UPI0035B7222B